MFETNKIEGKEAIEGMMRGVSCATDLIRGTYGGAGSNVVVESKLRPFHGVYNDAQSIIQALKVKGYAEKIGLDFVKELCERADKLAGDSRKTTLILLDEILKAGYQAKMNKLQLKRELDALIPFIEAEIDEQTVQIEVDDVEKVATTASENADTGKLLQEIYQKIGKNGIIQPEGSGTFETSYRFIEGVRFDMTGFLSPAMVHDEQAIADKVPETKAVYENPLILVTKKKITTDEDINPMLREINLMAECRPLVIFTQDMDSGVASMLVNLHKSSKFKILIIKAPVLWQNYIFEDFSKCVGATVIEDSTGKNFKNMRLADLGTCAKIVVDADETIIIGHRDISDHIAQLQAKGDDDSKLRLSWLVNKTVILKIGANSETDLSYKRLKCHDAIRSSELALKYGIVPGGGVCLASISIKMPSTEAGDILRQALKAPITQICANAGVNLADVGGDNQHGYDAKANKVVNMIDAGIVDASMVIKMAVRNAIGIASTILTASALVYIPEPTDTELRLQELNRENHAF